MKLEDLPQAYQDQIRRKLNAAPAAPPAPREPATTETNHGDPRPEAALQADVEAWLIRKGYARRSPKTIQRHTARRWFVHVIEAKINPIILDLLILDADRGTYLEIELKNAAGTLTPDQRALILRGEGKLCRSLKDVQDTVTAWEAQNPPRRNP